VYANFLGRSSFIISSREKAEELLSKRGAIYSNRPPGVLILNLYVVSNLAPRQASTRLCQDGMGGLERRSHPAWEETCRATWPLTEGTQSEHGHLV